ncbi:MAG: aminotransferase class IV family protein [Anaerolineae bacterium]|nr:aminotransferase class IV family protein [Anaerolineae bacterium]
MSSVSMFRACGEVLERVPVQADSLDEAALQNGHGVYTVFRLYPGWRVFRLASHFARLRHSADLLGEPFLLTYDWMRLVLRRVVEEIGLALVRIRLTVPFDAPETVFIALEPFTPLPAALYQEGVSVGLVEGRREVPRAKDSQFIEWRKKARMRHPYSVYEIMMYDGAGWILEGLSSNFFAVLDGELRTAGDGVLEGIARSILLEVAPSVLPTVLDPIHMDDLPRISEAMLTSSSRGVVPIVQVRGVVIGDGKPGPVAKALRAAYDAQIEQELEPL